MSIFKEGDNKPAVEFVNQLEAFPGLPTIGRRMCGIAAATMTINLVNYGGKTVSPETVLMKALSVQKIPEAWGSRAVEYHPVRVDDDGILYFVPIGEEDNNLIETIRAEIESDPFQKEHLAIARFHGQETFSMEETRKQYVPIISLSRGVDHRGLGVLFAEYGIHAEQYGSISSEIPPLEDITDKLMLGDLFIASVRHSQDSSHVVLLSGAKRRSRWTRSQEIEIEICDPLLHTPIWQNAADWYRLAFRGYGTMIYGKEK